MQAQNINQHITTTDTVASLPLKPVTPCSPDTPLLQILDRFRENPLLSAIPVLHDSEAVGVLTRDTTLQIFVQNYSHALYRRATAAEKMDTTPLIVSIHDTLTTASQRATMRSHQEAYTPLIVCDDSGYIGMVSVRKLLDAITRQQIINARHSNPLTGLPGNISIDSEVNRLLQAKVHFTLCHLDLDSFKAFNDYYGYEKGDLMIMMVAETLQQSAHQDDFIGHIGGDDFVYISTQSDWKERIEDCMEKLAAKFPTLYDDKARRDGYITTENRNGETQRFALASISIGALPCQPNRFSSHLKVAETVFELKHKAKLKPGNALVVDRRQS